MDLPDALQDWLIARRTALSDAGVDIDTLPDADSLLLLSDYAFERLRRDPALALSLDKPIPALRLTEDDEAHWSAQLRRYRHACSLRLLAREAAGLDDVDAVLRESTRIAEHCAEAALRAVEGVLAKRHGWPRRADGSVQRMVIFALGKLGGGELNFSSDIDLVFAYPETGNTDGARALDNETWFIRLGQRLIQLLDETTAEGFGFRVDMRLRPFGSVGRLALSFAAMEQYFQREGRDWERYAWIKARPIAGDIVAGEALIASLRPFIYRRYLDFTAIEGLREMKAMIEAEVQRRDLAEHLKLGPGGIREIEFVVQLHQLIRGGREPSLRLRGLLPALAALELAGHIEPATAARLRTAYRFLRRLENRLQMLRDEQVHTLPEDDFSRARLAAGLGYAHWSALHAALDEQRAVVREEFSRVFEARRRPQSGDSAVEAFAAYWRRIEEDADTAMLAEAGMPDAEHAHAALRGFVAATALRALSSRGRSRLDRLLPSLLAAVARSHAPSATLDRLLRLLHAVLGRSSYLALLDEQPAARERLIEVLARSALLAEQLAAHPLLLDDLLDNRSSRALADRQAIRAVWQEVSAGVPADDVEAQLQALNELRHSLAFRIARETLLKRQSDVDSAAQLAALADIVLEALLVLSLDDVKRAHGVLPDADAQAGIAIIGYGSLGGEELGFASDLDLVFLFRGAEQERESDGRRSLDAMRYRLRVVQKLVALLATVTSAGRLYEADLRLRPDGAKGMLLCSLRRFEEYQFGEAWAWEHQALVRARFVAGDPVIGEAFRRIRAEVLGQPRSDQTVVREVSAMRARMRSELDRSRPGGFDLKQGQGGLVDLEFLLQSWVLAGANAHPDMLTSGHTPSLIALATNAGFFTPEQATRLQQAHLELLTAALDCTLDGRPRLVSETPGIEQARAVIDTAWQASGLLRVMPNAAAEPPVPNLT